jgi:hypothetical protein
MARADDLSNGVQLALDATLARLGNEPDRVIELLNVSTPAELAQAVAYLSDCYQALLVRTAGGDRARAIVAFRRSIADGVATDDSLREQMHSMLWGSDDR